MKQFKLRNVFYAALSAVIYSNAPVALAQTETEVPIVRPTPPTMTAVQPVNPVSSKPGGPIIQSISAVASSLGPIAATGLISARFQFIVPNGNAVVFHREVVASNGNSTNFAANQAINNTPDQQKEGAEVTVLSNCGDNRYYVTYRAYILDADGNRSNEVRYTLHCNGG